MLATVTAGGAVADLERAVAGLGGDGVGHGVGGRVGVAGRGGDPDGRAVGDALGHGDGRGRRSRSGW